MKKFLIIQFIFSIVFSGSIYSQYALPFDAINKSHIEKGTEGILGAQCVGGLVYDDNTFENGYGFNPGYGIGKFVMKMTPTSYPFTVNQVCLALARTASGSANFTFDIVVYDETGTNGGPGNLIASIPENVVINIWPQVTWYDFTGISSIPQLNSGSYYIGISYDPGTMGSHYIGADESPTTTQRPGYGYIQSAWGTIQSFFTGYKVIGVRCDGTSQTYTHNIAVGPFLSLPMLFKMSEQKAIKAKIQNIGTSNETGIPIKFLVNGVQVNSMIVNLNAGAVDSVSFNWTPSDTGVKNLKIVSGLVNDEFRFNDTVSSNVTVLHILQDYVCIGNESNSIGYPFYTFYMDSRTDMLFTAAEIGYYWNISKIGFFVTNASSQVMNGFKVKMQNTPSTTVSSFTSNGWTEVYSGNYIVSGTGLQWITLQTPFWHSVYETDNLLIEICFNNSSYTANTLINGSTTSNKVHHAHQDIPSGDGCIDITAGSNYAIRPNICLIKQTWIVGNEINSKNIPNKFSLSQNYPNPFNPKTIITYSIPPSRGARGVTDVKLTIFDALGREVAILVNEKQSAGSYSVEWDGTNYSSGLYFYKIETENFTDVKKMLMVK